MSEINITRFFKDAAPMDYSASVAELGASAGADTWRAANADSEDYMMLDTPELRAEFCADMQSAGFSEADDFKSWTPAAINALFLQWVAGTIRESGLTPDSSDADWKDYQRRESDGQVSGNLFQDECGQVYFTIGS